MKRTRTVFARTLSAIVLLCASCPFAETSSAQAASPTINSSTVQYRTGVIIEGRNFGSQCADCEVLADYGRLNYKLITNSWSDKRILAQLPDLGLAHKVELVVKTQAGSSNRHPVTIDVQIQPLSKVNRLVKAGSVAGLTSHEFKSNDSLGDKGEISYDVSSRKPACGDSGLVFENADLLLGNRTRFGEAKIIKTPAKGCEKCTPLVVRYYHEPTGGLHYQLHIYWRKIEGLCLGRVRH